MKNTPSDMREYSSFISETNISHLGDRFPYLIKTALLRHVFLLCCIMLFTNSAFADVFQWEFIDPNNPSLGKQESSTLAPDGAGAGFDTVLGLLGRDLTKAYLFRADMGQFRIRTSILNDAYLSEAYLYNLLGDRTVARGADMSRSNLENARLEWSDLTMASFVGANLTGARLANATLTDADFSGANIANISLNGTTSRGFTDQQLYQTASYQQHNLGSIKLTANDLRGWDFTGQQMESAECVGAQFENAVFTDAIVAAANFSQSDLSASQLYTSGSYKNRQLNDIQLSAMDLSGWDFSGQSLVRARIRSSKLSDAIFDGANLTNAYVDGGDHDLQSDVSFRAVDFTNTTFSTNARWERADFTGANLEGARLGANGFVDSIFTDAIIRGADLSRVFNFGFTLENLYSTASYKSGDLTEIEVRAGDLTGADFHGVDLSGAVLVGVELDSANFRGATAVGVSIRGSLEGADFQDADLTDAGFTYDPVTSIDFRGADLSGAGFLSASLTGADLTDATVFGTRFVHANGDANLSKQQLYSTASYKAGLLGPIHLEGDLRGWDFRDQDLTGARFDRDSQLEGAHWEGATLRDTLFFVNAMAETDFRLADVRQVRFSGSNLDRSDFRGTDLSGTVFSSTSLIGARFDGGQLSTASFVRADLQGANFTDADLRGTKFYSTEDFAGADFSGADIVGADFSYATDAGFTVQQLSSTRSYQQRNLMGVDFESVDFPGIDLSGFHLVGVNFRSADLVGANLSRTDLTGAIFSHAEFADLDLTDAIVRRATFSLAVRKGFTRAMLESTASYKNRELSGIDLAQNDLLNWDFHGQDLREARFVSSDLSGALFDLADLRGAALPSDLSGVDLQRAIRPDGTLSLLRVEDGEILTIHSAPTSIAPGVRVFGLTVQIDGALELLLGEGEWDSTLIFSSVSRVTIGGMLKLTFDELANPAAAVGQSFDLFDWSSRALNGEFDVVTDPDHIWDLSGLYTTGVVQLIAVVPEPSTMVIVTGLVICSTLTRRRREFRTTPLTSHSV